MLSIAGSSLQDDRVSHSLIGLIQRHPELHAYVVHKLFWALNDDISQISLVHVGMWCMGEYGHQLLQDPPTNEDTLCDKKQVQESTIVDLFVNILKHFNSSGITKGYALTALVKLTTRFQTNEFIQRINGIIVSFNNSAIVEIQQRACEYSTLGHPRWNSLRPDILAAMPPVDVTKARARQGRASIFSSTNGGDLLGVDDTHDDASIASPRMSSKSIEVVQKKAPEKNLLDLDDIFGGGAPSASTSASTSAATAPAGANTVDLLADIFSSPATTASTSAPPAAPVSNSFGGTRTPPTSSQSSRTSSANELFGLVDFGGNGTATATSSAPGVAASVVPSLRGYEKNGVTMDFETLKPNPADPSITYIQVTFRNANSVPLQNFLFQAAFPKVSTSNITSSYNRII
jgi:AP-1 complex subunit gamma-1